MQKFNFNQMGNKKVSFNSKDLISVIVAAVLGYAASGLGLGCIKFGNDFANSDAKGSTWLELNCSKPEVQKTAE